MQEYSMDLLFLAWLSRIGMGIQPSPCVEQEGFGRSLGLGNARKLPGHEVGVNIRAQNGFDSFWDPLLDLQGVGRLKEVWESLLRGGALGC